jgi:hypothetical protein
MLNTKVIDQIFAESNSKYNDFLDFFNSIHLSIQIIPLKIGVEIVRARHSQPNETFTEFKDFRYPPVTNGFSRIGTPGQIWFYGSENYETCLMEMLPFWIHEYQLGSEIRVTFGWWQIRERLNLLVFPDFSLKTEVSKQLKLSEYYSPEEQQVWEQLDKYFYLPTNVQQDVYQLTSALVSSMLLRLDIDNTKIDGILYPSAQQGERSNIALTKEAVDRNHVLLNKTVDGIFKKANKLKENGLPSYAGPFNTRSGNFNHEKRTVTWIE